jgi:hypothetical protein
MRIKSNRIHWETGGTGDRPDVFCYLSDRARLASNDSWIQKKENFPSVPDLLQTFS